MTTPRLVMLHVTAIDYGTHYVVINRSGKKSAVVRRKDTGQFSPECVARLTKKLQWRAAFQRMRNALCKRVDVSAMCDWERKFRTWQHSLKLRARYERAPKQNKRYFTDDARPDWERAAECMLMSYYNRVVRKQKHAADPWLRWAETTSKNHNRKERCRGIGD